MPDAPALLASPLHALCVYAEPLIGGRRVVVFGDSRRRLGERLLELGARVVHSYDPDANRALGAAADTPRGLTIKALPSTEFDVRDGAFDVAVVADIAELPQPAALLGRIRRLLAVGGAILVRSRVAEAPSRSKASARREGRDEEASPDYYELYDLVAMQFAHVRMVGQIPWSGVALAELGGSSTEPDVTVDTQLVTEATAPDAYIAVGSQEPVEIAEYSLVQLPPAAVAVAPDVEATIVYGNEKANLAAAQLRASLLEAQIDELRTRRNEEGAAHAETVSGLELELANRLTELQQAEARTREASLRSERAVAELRSREEELARVRDRAALASKEIEDERRLRARADLELAAAQRNVEALLRDAEDVTRVIERVPAIEAAAVQLEAQARELALSLAVAEEARSSAELLLAAALRELEGARIEGERASTRAALADAAIARATELERLLDERAAIIVAPVDETAIRDLLTQEHARLVEHHALELAELESALQQRARDIRALEHELGRRERIVHDLVHALEEAREIGSAVAPSVVAAEGGGRQAALTERRVQEANERASAARAENDALRLKLDAFALEIARREGEAATAAWRIQELEQAVSRLEDEQSELTMTIPPPAFLKLEREVSEAEASASQRLAAAEDELDVLRQALAQEHAAKAKLESGEALAQAREELARQAALLERLSRELEARDGVLPRSDATAAGPG